MVAYPQALAPADAAIGPGPEAALAPTEYTAAVDRYLDQAALGVASRRVYRISLAGWAWPLVGRPVPSGAKRRGAIPPLVALAFLDDPAAAGRLAAAVTERAATTDPRTVNRELSALRSAVTWWRDQGWISADPTAGLRHRPAAAAPPRPLDAAQVATLLGLPAELREQALWRVLYDSGAPAATVLALDAHQLDLSRHRVRPQPESSANRVEWQPATSQILRWLLSGRTWGPVFLTDRRALPQVARADVCPLTGQARMSYRRAAEIFAALTRPLDPAGKGWTLHQLSTADHPQH